MSYVNMDHAQWVQHQIAPSKRIHNTAKDRRKASEGRGWLAAPDTLTEFQKRAFNILGIVGGGIYNAPIAWDGVYWGQGQPTLALAWSHRLATFDFTALTTFVFLCHEARIRGEISPNNMRTLEIMLSARVADGSMSRRHPNLEEAVAAFREHVGNEHSIRYRAA